MTQRLYYDDPYLLRFSASVVEDLQWEGQTAVVLDRSAFYPTGGGQPHDSGTLSDSCSSARASVVDVVEREADGAVIHVLDQPLEARVVDGEVEWDRRFDLMQQHTGQHILSAAFLEHLDANTVSFHLSGEYATIDLDQAPISTGELERVEALANAVVFEDRQATARFVSDDEIPLLPLRKPLAHEGPVRVVEIPDLDCSACGGTHVQSTGQVGLIKITRSERRGAETRIEFLCGRRALADYRTKNALLMDLAREYTVGYWEIGALVDRLTGDLKDTRRELRRARDGLLDAEAMALWHQGTTVASARVVRADLPGRTPDDLKHLAQRLVTHEQTVALLAAAGPGQKGFFTFARSEDLEVHMGNLVRQACQVIGGGGGGRPAFAQGGGPQGARIAQALDEASQSLTEALVAQPQS